MKLPKTLETLLDAFIWIYRRLIYSLVFPLAITLIVTIGKGLETLEKFLLSKPTSYIIISIVVGACLKNWRDKKD